MRPRTDRVSTLVILIKSMHPPLRSLRSLGSYALHSRCLAHSATRMSECSPQTLRAEPPGQGLNSAVGLRPRLRVRPPTYGPSTRRRPLACGPQGCWRCWTQLELGVFRNNQEFYKVSLFYLMDVYREMEIQIDTISSFTGTPRVRSSLDEEIENIRRELEGDKN